MENIYERLVHIVVEQLGVDKEAVSKTSRFTDDLGADSLDVVELVMAIEEEFSIEVPDDQAEKMFTVQDALNYIQANAS